MIQLVQSKKKDKRKITFKDELLRRNSLKVSCQEKEQPATKKCQEPLGLGEHNLVIEMEVSESASENENYPSYIEQLIRYLTEQNKNIKGLRVTVWKKSMIKMI